MYVCLCDSMEPEFLLKRKTGPILNFSRKKKKIVHFCQLSYNFLEPFLPITWIQTVHLFAQFGLWVTSFKAVTMVTKLGQPNKSCSIVWNTYFCFCFQVSVWVVRIFYLWVWNLVLRGALKRAVSSKPLKTIWLGVPQGNATMANLIGLYNLKINYCILNLIRAFF